MSTILKPIFFLFALSLISCNAHNEGTEIFATPPTKQTEFEIDDNGKIEAEPITTAPTTIKGFITRKGFENIMFGMTEAEIRTAFKAPLFKEYDPEYPECYYLYEDNGEISFMIYYGTLQRIDVYNSPDIITNEGAAIGISFKTIEKLYPNSFRKPNFYTYPDENLIVQLDENMKIIFEQSANEMVRHFRVGTIPSIDFVEGCL